MRGILTVVCAVALGGVSGAGAQKVYRCGPDGRVYQQTPCAEGQVVDASDPRSAEQRKAAQAVARDDAKAAARFDREMMPASSAKDGKTRAQPAPTQKVDPAGSAKPASKKASAPASRPPMYLAQPVKPKAAASTAKP